MDPFAGVGFEEAQRIGNRDGWWQTGQQVNVIRYAIHRKCFAFEFSRKASQIGMEFRLQIRNN